MIERAPASERHTRPVSWWQTLPGVLTAVAAVITAVTGLVIALKPSSSPPPAGSRDAAIVEPAQSGSSPVIDRAAGTRVAATGGATTAAGSLPLPTPSEVKLAAGAMDIRILSMRLEPFNAQNRSLTIRLRYLNSGRYPANFWSASFRLLVDGVPRAPTNLLDEVVAGQSATDGDVVFEVPAAATMVTLRVLSGDEHTDIPFDLR
jgi:hypothetical protein